MKHVVILVTMLISMCFASGYIGYLYGGSERKTKEDILLYLKFMEKCEVGQMRFVSGDF